MQKHKRSDLDAAKKLIFDTILEAVPDSIRAASVIQMVKELIEAEAEYASSKAR